MKFIRPLLVGSVLLLPLIAAAQGNSQFVPLLPSLPGLDTLRDSNNLSTFLSQIYKICIGLAAVLAVLQIMRAGVMYMGGDSVTEKKDARNLIMLSVIGLVLVLSPVIVFSVINPDILKLDIDTSELQTDTSGITSSAQVGDSVIPASSVQDCKNKGGVAAGDATHVICTVPSNSAAAAATTACNNFKDFETAPTGGRCETILGESYVKVDNQCCSPNLGSGSQCCALHKPQ